MIEFTKEPTAPSLPFTSEQNAVLNSNADSILVDSTSGSGKSTLLKKLAFDNPKAKILYLAYNRSIVESIKGHLPANCDIFTFHAFGLSIVRNNLDSFKVNFNKYRKYTKIWDVSMLVQKHLSLGGANGLKAWNATCDRFYINHKHIPEARVVLRESNESLGVVSAEDMLSLPVRENYKIDQYDIVLVDEYQDLGTDKLQLVVKIPTERIVFVGDRNQKINGFMGSDPFVEETLGEAYKISKFEINESFRCPRNVIDQANEYVPEMFGSKTGGVVNSIKAKDMSIHDYPEESLILCRANAPLLVTARKFIDAGIDFKINPKTINKLENIVKRLAKRTSTISMVKGNCVEERRKKEAIYKQKGWNASMLGHRYDAVMAVLNVGNNIGDSIALLKKLGGHGQSLCSRRLSTIHSAKGLESNNVFYIQRGISDKIAENASADWEVDQEDNTQFVGITRSLNNLTYVD